MVEEIRQDGRVILSSEDGFSVPMIFNNLCGKNFIGKEYKDYIRHIAFEEMGLKPGIVSHYRNGVLYKNGTIYRFIVLLFSLLVERQIGSTQ